MFTRSIIMYDCLSCCSITNS